MLRSRTFAAIAAFLGATLVATATPTAAQAPTATTLTEVGRLTAPYGQFFQKAHSEAFSTAAVGDVTGDGAPDIVVGGMDGVLRVYATTGRRVLSHYTGPGAISASPTLVDLDRDGVLDILTANEAGTVEVVTGSGRVIFRQNRCAPGRPCAFFGTPVAGDLNGDGHPEIVATNWDHHVYAWTSDGRILPGFPVFLLDTLWSSPTLADLDGDGRREIIFGGDMDENYPGQPYPPGGLLWVIRADGSTQPGFPRSLPGQTIWSSPAVVDLNGDGLLDIVVGTGTNFPSPRGSELYALDRAGNDLPGWNGGADMPGRTIASPAVGDLDGDGRPEVAVLSEGGNVVVVGADGRRRWLACNRSSTTSCDTVASTHGSVAIADVDGDGRQEVVSAAEHVLRVFDGASGAVEAERVLDGQVWAPAASPTIATVDGVAWIVLNTTVNTNPDGGRGVGDSNVVFVWTTGQPLRQADWPTFKQNSQRTGRELPMSPPSGACPVAWVVQAGFTDVWATNVHQAAIDCARWFGVAAGVTSTRYAPNQVVKRDQMATFLVRAIERAQGEEMPPGDDAFADDAASVHEANINKLTAAGVVGGFADGSFGPSDTVTRAQMATFLVRAYQLLAEPATLPIGTDSFSDDSRHTHETNINKAATAGFASGVGGGRFAPNLGVQRDQMASFLMRMMGRAVQEGLAALPGDAA